LSGEGNERPRSLSEFCLEAAETSDRTWSSVLARIADLKDQLSQEERLRLERDVATVLSFQPPCFPASLH
jgi:hypothetical protein